MQAGGQGFDSLNLHQKGRIIVELLSLLSNNPFEKGKCDDIILLVVEYDYRMLTKGWNFNDCDRSDLSHMEVNIDDKNCLAMFLSWCNNVYNALDYKLIKMLLDVKYHYILSNNSFPEIEVFRLTIMKELLSISLLESAVHGKRVLKQIYDIACLIATPTVCDKCKDYFCRLNEGE